MVCASANFIAKMKGGRCFMPAMRGAASSLAPDCNQRHKHMHYRYFQAVASCAAAIALATTTSTANPAPQWTSFAVGTLSSSPPGYGLVLERLSDGRFIFGDQGSLYVQTAWGAAATSQISGNGVTFDPSFIALASDSVALLGQGGTGATSGLFGFNPSSASTPLASTALTTALQNFSAVYWQHPTSGNKGWLVGGTNASGKHNLSFVSLDGTKVGAVTAAIGTYSSGVCTDASGNVYAALSEYMTVYSADSEKVLKFTADQIDTAVAAVIAGSPAPIARDINSSVHQFDSAASIAVDSLGRLWAGGYNGHIQVYDPANGFARTFTPDNPPITGAAGPTSYLIQTFAHAGVNYIGFLASDSYASSGTSIFQGYKPESEVVTRAVSFTQNSGSASESSGPTTITVHISPAPTATVTVPFSVAGTAHKGKDYSIAQSAVVFSAGETARTIAVNLIDVGLIGATNKTLVIKLGAAVPATQAYVPAGADTFTLTILEDDQKPVIAATQNFTEGRIGSAYSYQVLLAAGTATKFTASGLPPGMTINSATGVISGRPTVPGEYDQVWITATSPSGTAISTGYVITVADFATAAHGSFAGYVDRDVAATGGVGARIDVNVTNTAAFTGKVTVGTVVCPLSGLLDTSTTNPTSITTFKRGGTPYTLTFTIDAATGALGGTIGAAAIHGWRAQTASTLTGPHNFFAATPGGPAAGDPHGTTYGSVNVLATGVASTSVHGADGAVFATSAPMGPGGEVLIYQTAYAVSGSLLGNLTIAGDATQTVGGTVTWSRPVAAGGWATTVSLTASGGKYHPVSGSGIVMGIVSGTGNNAKLAFQDGGVSAATTSPNLSLRIDSPVMVTIAAPDKLTIVNSTGAFSGSFRFVTGTGSVMVPFQGLIVPDTTTPDPFDGTGEGFFLLPGAASVVTGSGMVSLSAGP